MGTTLKNYIVAINSIVFLSFSNAYAITYTTVNNGNWNDVVNVWSTNGGVSPCGCTPGFTSGANNIVVNHLLTAGSNLNFNGGTLTVNALGKITSSSDIISSNTTIDIFGNLDIKKYDQGTGVTAIFHPAAIVMASGKITLNGGTLTMDGSLVNSGGFENGPLATFTLINSARYAVTSGNAVNNGIMNIDITSCFSTNGNIRNNATGVINGNGALDSGGNLQNNGTVSVGIAWCANGAGLGMPSPEDCATAGVICGSITLPVELTSFTAEPIATDYIQLDWSTASENNSSHFVVVSSRDGKNWMEIGSVNAAGFSNETVNYAFEDYNVNYGTTYYKLIQFDIDNRESESDVIAIHIEGEAIEISMYPNPIRSNNALTIVNLETSEGSIGIYTMSGQLIQSHSIDGMMSSTQITIGSLEPGIYILNVEQLGAIKTKRLVITE